MNTPSNGQEAYLQLAPHRAHILGSDECGFGSWAGPLLTCAVAVPYGWKPPKGLNDSKKVSANRRSDLYETLREKVPYAYEMSHSDEIDQGGIMAALHRCYKTCIGKLLQKFPEALVVIDGEVRIPDLEHLNFPKADGVVPAIMAASIIGKVIHDRFMQKLGEQHPGYGFGIHMGYGTPQHQEAVAKKGPIPGVHRTSYLPIKKLKDCKDFNEPGIILDTGDEPDLSHIQ